MTGRVLTSNARQRTQIAHSRAKGPKKQLSETDAQFDLQSTYCRAFRPSGREDRCICSWGERALGPSYALVLNPPSPALEGFLLLTIPGRVRD